MPSFFEQSIRDSIERRRHQRQFIARGLASREEGRRTETYVGANAVLIRLERMLAEAKARK